MSGDHTRLRDRKSIEEWSEEAAGDEMDHRTSSTYASANLISDGSFLRECARGFLGVDLEDLLPNSDNA